MAAPLSGQEPGRWSPARSERSSAERLGLSQHRQSCVAPGVRPARAKPYRTKRAVLSGGLSLAEDEADHCLPESPLRRPPHPCRCKASKAAPWCRAAISSETTLAAPIVEMLALPPSVGLELFLRPAFQCRGVRMRGHRPQYLLPVRRLRPQRSASFQPTSNATRALSRVSNLLRASECHCSEVSRCHPVRAPS